MSEVIDCSEQKPPPYTDFERKTGFCPWMIAWNILEEIEVNLAYTFTPELENELTECLAEKAILIYAHNEGYRRRIRPTQRGRMFVHMFMRHWVSGLLRSKVPALFKRLPESFWMGVPLSSTKCSTGPNSIPRKSAKSGGASPPKALPLTRKPKKAVTQPI